MGYSVRSTSGNRIRGVGKKAWKNCLNDTEREKGYVQMK